MTDERWVKILEAALELALHVIEFPGEYEPAHKNLVLQELKATLSNLPTNSAGKTDVECFVHGKECFRCGVAADMEIDLLLDQRGKLLDVIDTAKKLINHYPGLMAHAETIGFFETAENVTNLIHLKPNSKG